jgi:hypothetical protein
MQKAGETDIQVESSNVAQHERLGWTRAKIAISADGQTLTVPYGTAINFDLGALKINAVQVVTSANELNNLDLNEDLVMPVRYQITPDAVSTVGVHAAVNLAAAAQNVTSAITNPDVPRTVTVKGNVSGIAGNVVITGTNINDEAITDTIALNGASEVEGVKAFKTVTLIALPARTHVPAYQVETATAVGTISTSGNAAVIVTAAGMTGSPITLSVAVLENDTASQVAAKIITALGLNAVIAALFTIGGTGATVTLTNKSYAADDNTLNISIDNDTCVGLTTAGTSANTTAGVPVDTVSAGIAKKFGLPHSVDNASLLQEKIFDGSDDLGTLAVDDDEVEKNLFALDGTPDGSKVLDLVYLK